MKAHNSNETLPKFSLMLGGPLYQLGLRLHLVRPELELLPRRIAVLLLIVWLPPLVLSLIEGRAFGGVRVPYVFDVAAQIRFLVSLPLLLLAERIMSDRMSPMIGQFEERGIMPPQAVSEFRAIVGSVLRWRNSATVEVGILLLTFTVIHFILMETTIKSATWFADLTPSGLQLTKAGCWFTWVSMPLFQFILLRWFYRWGLWTIFLWRVSQLPLRLVPTHPDRAAGLSFLSRSAVSFCPVVAALSAVVAGVTAGKILYGGATLASFKVELIVAILFLIAMALGPLCLFIPRLLHAKLEGELEYGRLASDYVAAFDQKWNRQDAPPSESLLGSSDIQSLADMGNSYSVVNDLHLVPFDRDAIIQTAAAAMIPLAPLIFFVIPLDQLILKLLKVLF